MAVGYENSDINSEKRHVMSGLGDNEVSFFIDTWDRGSASDGHPLDYLILKPTNQVKHRSPFLCDEGSTHVLRLDDKWQYLLRVEHFLYPKILLLFQSLITFCLKTHL